MMRTYLAEETEAQDESEFLTMAEAAELGQWEIVKAMAETSGDAGVTTLADGRSVRSESTSRWCARAVSNWPAPK